LNISERTKDEKPLGNSGVGKNKSRGCEDDVIAIEQVDVDNARAVSGRRGAASKSLFDALKLSEEFVRILSDEELEDCVKEGSGPWGASHGRGFVNLRAEYGLRAGMEEIDSPAGRLEICKARFDV
jgi:hypothetical protein